MSDPLEDFQKAISDLRIYAGEMMEVASAWRIVGFDKQAKFYENDSDFIITKAEELEKAFYAQQDMFISTTHQASDNMLNAALAVARMKDRLDESP